MEVWSEVQKAAEEAYDRSENCTFTSFIAYENTSTPLLNNWHRNVIFRNDRVVKKPVNAIDMAAMVVGGVGYVFKWGDVVLDYRALHYNVGGQKLIDEMTASGLSMGAHFHF